MAKLESLIVDLQLQTAEFQKGLDEANQKLEGFGHKLHSLSEVVELKELGEMAMEAAKKLGEFVIGGAEVQEKMGRMSQAAGVSVESFSRLNYAAGMSGVSTEQLGTAMKKLNGNISDAATGSAKQVALFSALGVAVKDSSGHVRNAGDVMQDLAGKFAGMGDGVSKSKLEVALFGKAGDEMTRMLNRGKSGLQEFGEEADRLGVTVSGPAAESAERFMENLNRLHAVVGAVAQQVAANLTPSLERLTGELLNNKNGADGMKGAVEFLSNLLRVMASGAIITAAAFQMLGEGIGKAASAAVDFANGGKAPEDNGSAAINARLSLARGELAFAKQNVNDADANGRPLGEIEGMIDAANKAQKRVDALAASLDALNAPKPAADPMGPMDKALERLSAVWSTSADEAKKAAEVHKTTGDKIAAAFAAGEAAAGPFKEAMKALTSEASRLSSEVVAFGKGDMAKLDASLEGGKLANDLSKVGANAAGLKVTIHALGQELHDLEIGKIETATRFAQERMQGTSDASNTERTTAFNNIGPAGIQQTMKVISSATAGFSDFQNALAKMTSATQEQIQLQGLATIELKNGHEEEAQALNLAADEAGRAAGKASKAADAFGKLAETVVQQQQQIVSMALSVIGSIGKSGSQIAGVISSAMQGMAAGGPIGAIIAVIATLLAKLASVGEFVDGVFSQVMTLLQKLNGGLGALLNAVMGVLTPLFEILGPVFDLVGGVIMMVVLAIEYLWDGILKAVRAVIAVLTLGQGTQEIDATIKKHEATIKANEKALNQTMTGTTDENANSDKFQFGTMRTSNADTATLTGQANVRLTAALAAATSADTAAAAAHERLNDALRAHDERTIAAAQKAADAADATAKSTRDVADAADAFAAAVQTPVTGGATEIGGVSYMNNSDQGAQAAFDFAQGSAMLAGKSQAEADAAGNAARDAFRGMGTAANTAAAALNKFSSSLTNVPQGFKYAARAFEATRSMTSVRSGSEAGGTTIIVQGSVITENQLVTMIADVQNRRQFRRNGISMTANLR